MTRSIVLVLQYDLPNGYRFLNPTNLLVYKYLNLNLNLINYDVPELI